jgi:hypothetical protein
MLQDHYGSIKKNNTIISYYDRFIHGYPKSSTGKLKIEEIIKKMKKFKSEKKMNDYDKIAY